MRQHYEIAIEHSEKLHRPDTSPTNESKDHAKSVIAWARTLVPNLKHVASRTVRDFYRKSGNYGPSFVLPADQGCKRGDSSRPSLSSRLAGIDHKGSGSRDVDEEDCIMLVGDIVPVRLEDGAEDVLAYRLLRLSKPQSKMRTNPRSHVTGHYLQSAEDELLVYDSIADDVSVVRYQEVILGPNRLPLVIPREQLDVVLADGGGLSFQLHPEFEDVIEAALAFEESDLEPEEDVDTELENLDSQALKEHTVRMRQQQRLSFSEQVCQVGGRSTRSRQPTRRFALGGLISSG